MPFIATMVHFPNQKENQGPSSIKRIERLNLDGFEKLLASVIPKGRVFKILIILMSNLSPKYPPN